MLLPAPDDIENVDEWYHDEIVSYMAAHNDPTYNRIKLAEELAELSEVVLKSVNKKGTEKEPDKQSIIDELGDVLIRVNVLIGALDAYDAVEERMRIKFDKFRKAIKEKKYKNI